MILKSLHLENFKGIKSLDVNFSKKTKIKGQNASGKTTVFDAFTWLLFNKNSAGEEKFNVRPLDKDGKRIDDVEIKVVATLDVDGKEVELSKVQKQNWVKKRGTDTVSLQGNVNSFEIDGYPKSESDFKEYVAGLAKSEDMFKMLTNPQYFNSMKWKDQRKILMKLVDDFSDVELAKTDERFLPLISELEKAPSVEDIRSKFQKMLSEWKKKQAEIPVRIDEAEKSKVDVDAAEQELKKSDLERRISEIYEKISDTNGALKKLRDEDMRLQMDMSGILQSMNDSLSEKKRKIESSNAEVTRELENTRNKIQIAENAIKLNERSISDTDVERKKLGEQYNAEKAKVFDETPFLFDESKWVFDESSTVCSLCGQPLPEDKIEQLKADFESRKVKAKESAAKRLSDAKEAFMSEKKDNLERIKAFGFDKKHTIDGLTEKNKELNVEIESLKKREQELVAKGEELSKQLDKIPKEADYTQNEEYMKLHEQREKVFAEIEKEKSSWYNERIAELQDEKKEMESELDSVKEILAKASMNVDIDERIAELQDEKKEIGQKVADQEQILYLLEEFVRFKLNKISESINSHFDTVNFKLFEMQLNGGMRDCCECTVNGVPYSTLNSGHRIVAGLDIIRSLSKMYGVECPIFIDNAESLNEFNVPDMDAQLILLSVSDDKKLEVEVLE
jgi:DNA repair exonuclease SbcCD ATPase subunit